MMSEHSPEWATSYYDVLGVTRGATPEEIKQAYRRLAMELHPDRNPDDQDAADRFRAATEAYAILSDSNQRQSYDRAGHQNFDPSGAEVRLGIVGEVLEGLLGGMFSSLRRRASKRPRSARDLTYTLELTFEEAALGTEKEIEVLRPIEEPPGAAREVTERLTVRIPAGVETGSVRTVPGGGEITPQARGDLHVYIQVAPHAHLRRKGGDVMCDVMLSYPQVVLGTEVEVPTLQGMVTMRIPPGTKPGRVFRLRGRGAKMFGGAGRGDQMVTVGVEVPEAVTPDQRQILEQLAISLERTRDRNVQGGFIDRVRNWF